MRSGHQNWGAMSGRAEATRKWLVLLCSVVVWSAGCFTKQPPKSSIMTIVNLRPPIVPAGSGAALMEPPEIIVDTAEEPPEIATMRPAPAKPRVAPAPTAEPDKSEKHAEPVIVPELSTQELESAKAETQHNLDLMDKNLSQTTGKTLNASQQDLVSKVRGFADNAREAMRGGDWVRAKNLSKKAEVLSEELVAGL
jgi:hypothetical protein